MRDPTPPDRDLYALTQRLVLRFTEPIPRVVNAQSPNYQQGRKDTFSVLNIVTNQVYPVSATLQLVTDHAYWYMGDDVAFSMQNLEKSARLYEERIRPRIVQVFGEELIPGVDNDTRLTILHAPLSGLAGYFSSTDEYPTQVHPSSNQREIIYIDTSFLELNTREYLGTLAHEFTHAVHFRADRTEDTWVNEGLAEMGRELAGYRSSFRSSYLSSTQASLVLWSDNPSSNMPNYGGASLFMEYLAQQYGLDSLRLLMNEGADSIQGVQAYLEAVEAQRDFRQVFADWIVANYLDDPDDTAYGYVDQNIQVHGAYLIREPTSLKEQVEQYGVRYYTLNLDAAQATVRFQGQTQTTLLPVSLPGDGSCWWGNRGDSIDSTLTRWIDLSQQESATLTYSLWYDIENGWDFAYLEVSTDDGATWDILETKHSTSRDPLGNAFGPGYTGQIGWTIETVDLTQYAGLDVLLRFEYVTDDTVNGAGICLGNIAINNAELADAGWDALGFIQTDNRVSQSYIVRVIEIGQETVVRDISLDNDQHATFTIEGLGTGVDRAIIIVSAIAEHTAVPAQFNLEVTVP
jgi:immune inhibitor A